MTNETIEIVDHSNDKKYFTMMPNIIIDHVGMEAHSLYVIVKRHAGEKGRCFASEKTLRDEMRSGRVSLKKGLKELLDGGWIVAERPEKIQTKGGRQTVAVYSIPDVWKRNTDYFQQDKGMLKTDDLAMSKTTDLLKTADLEPQRYAENDTQGMLKTARKKNPIKKNQLIHNTGTAPSADIVEIIDSFKPVNPAFGKWYGNTTQRAAIDRMIKIHGKDQMLKVIAILPKTNIKPWIPNITSPLELEDRWAKLANALVKEKEKLQNKETKIL